MLESFRLIYGDLEIDLTLPLDAVAGEQLLDRIRQAKGSEPVQTELAKRIVAAIAGLFDAVVIPPTKRQLKYARAICDELQLVLPEDCTRFQDATRAFITQHAPEYQRRRGYRPPGAAPGTQNPS
ncbi:MAG: hypothetical protein EPN60_01995 [Nevskiaceae bacterium]|nr:MAG: hypothetical protein EPN60_01995 [Nevskiaceae bacterium]